MKKIDIKELIVIAIGIFALCFAISKFIFCKFNMASDYLTASATFFTAFAALYLYNDWKTPHQIELLERQKEKILNLFLELENDFDVFYLSVYNVGVSKEYEVLAKASKKLIIPMETLMSELDFYEKILEKLNINQTDLQCKPNECRQFIFDMLKNLNNALDPSDMPGSITRYKNILNKNNYVRNLKLNKVYIVDDIQDIVLKLYEFK